MTTSPSNGSPAPQAGKVTSTTLGANLLIRGELRGEEEVILEGRVEGIVELKGHLHVAAGGVVSASVHVTELTVAGTVQGDIVATDRVAISATGRVSGDIQAPRIIIADGAVVQGALNMNTPTQREATSREPERSTSPRPTKAVTAEASVQPDPPALPGVEDDLDENGLPRPVAILGRRTVARRG